MSYPVKYRWRVVEYRREGHTYAETKETFKVSISTIDLFGNSKHPHFSCGNPSHFS